MAEYRLQPNEVFLLKEDNVSYSGGPGLSDLRLTNLNLVIIRKGILGVGKGMAMIPLDTIKVYNQQAQAVVGRSRSGQPELAVYVLDGNTHKVTFHSAMGTKKAAAWATQINEVVTGQKAPETATGMAIPGAGLVAGVLKDTISVFKSKLGPAPVQTAGKCRTCGAPISGMQAQTLACGYCGSVNQL